MINTSFLVWPLKTSTIENIRILFSSPFDWSSSLVSKRKVKWKNKERFLLWNHELFTPFFCFFYLSVFPSPPPPLPPLTPLFSHESRCNFLISSSFFLFRKIFDIRQPSFLFYLTFKVFDTFSVMNWTIGGNLRVEVDLYLFRNKKPLNDS